MNNLCRLLSQCLWDLFDNQKELTDWSNFKRIWYRSVHQKTFHYSPIQSVWVSPGLHSQFAVHLTSSTSVSMVQYIGLWWLCQFGPAESQQQINTLILLPLLWFPWLHSRPLVFVLISLPCDCLVLDRWVQHHRGGMAIAWDTVLKWIWLKQNDHHCHDFNGLFSKPSKSETRACACKFELWPRSNSLLLDLLVWWYYLPCNDWLHLMFWKPCEWLTIEHINVNDPRVVCCLVCLPWHWGLSDGSMDSANFNDFKFVNTSLQRLHWNDENWAS